MHKYSIDGGPLLSQVSDSVVSLSVSPQRGWTLWVAMMDYRRKRKPASRPPWLPETISTPLLPLLRNWGIANNPFVTMGGEQIDACSPTELQEKVKRIRVFVLFLKKKLSGKRSK